MAGEIVHIELPSSDFARSAAFYSKLFGWKTDGAQSGGHLLFSLPGGIQGSWIRDALAQAPGPVPFVAVADVEKALAEAERLGGRVLVRRMTLAHRGTFGLVADCDGNVIGLLAAGGAARVSTGARDEAGEQPAEALPAKGRRPEVPPDARSVAKPPGKPASKPAAAVKAKPGAPKPRGRKR